MCTHMPNVIPTDGIVCVVNVYSYIVKNCNITTRCTTMYKVVSVTQDVLVVFVAIVNELRSYL